MPLSLPFVQTTQEPVIVSRESYLKEADVQTLQSQALLSRHCSLSGLAGQRSAHLRKQASRQAKAEQARRKEEANKKQMVKQGKGSLAEAVIDLTMAEVAAIDSALFS